MKRKMQRFLTSIITSALIINSVGNFAFKTNENSFTSSALTYEQQIAAIQKKAAALEKQNKEYSAEIKSAEYAAKTADEQKEIAEQAIKKLNEEISYKGELITLQIEAVDEKETLIGNKTVAIENKRIEIETKDSEIIVKDLEINKLQKDNYNNTVKFGEMLRELYMNDWAGDGDVFAGGADFYDILVLPEYYKGVAEVSDAFMVQLLESIIDEQQKLTDLEFKKKTLEKEKATFLIEKQILEDDKVILEQELSELDDAKKALQLEIAKRESEYRTYIEEYDKMMSRAEELHEEMESSAEEIAMLNAEMSEIQEALRQQQEAAKKAAESGNVTKDYTGSGFTWPLSNAYRKVAVGYGYDAWRRGMHWGIDINGAGIRGQTIYAAQEGTVLKAFNDGGWHGGWGNYVLIDHGGGISTLYAHTITGGVKVRVGDHVAKGQPIALVGTTGNSFGNHLHFEVYVNGKRVNPMNYSYG